MWPFKKKEAKPVEPNHRIVMIARLAQWRAIGDEFEYLGRRMVVSAHWRISGGYPFGLFMEPCLQADYADNNGVIHNVSFGVAESEALMNKQPNNQVERQP